MALLREKVTTAGVAVPYWSIGETNINWARKNAVIVLYGYISEGAKRSNKDFVEVVQFRWQDEAFPFQSGKSVIVTAYQKIKQHPDWSSAKDLK